jgi:hypothetical protein
MTGTVWACKYLNIASERQRPTRRMVSASIRPQSRAIAPPARRLRAVMSCALMPMVGQRGTASRRMLVMREPGMMVGWGRNTVASGVLGLALCCLR